VSSQYTLDNNQGLKLPPFALWDAQIRDTWGPLTVFVKVNNITDRRYAESVTFGGAVPELPRSYWAGTSIQF
jgi:outer membrane receptor protein involved in Fe transport